ncbi:MAG TPA: crosslink repair DNA glycosylase YcaQ family protein, partial [Candidatus Dormibacteraeota bacterium]|nr:crosslink repair DNA glycosylase YcaQ family protein [Candidatus Dormibacteraeota bacterium]
MRARFAAQLLSGTPARDPVSVVERLLAVQAQDGRGARLAIRARSTGLTVADTERALTTERSLLITWLNRGTLHLVRTEDYWWLHALTTPQLRTGNARRLEQEGVSPDAAERDVKVITRALAGGPLTRYELRDRVAAAGVPVQGQALIHLLFLASLRGHIVRGPMHGIHHAYVLTGDWIGPAHKVDRDRALTQLAIRYLAGHGPASDRDLAKWAGISLGVARSALRSAGESLDESGGLSNIKRRGPAPPLPRPRLLGAFEPVLLGWASREPVLPDDSLLVRGGMFL